MRLWMGMVTCALLGVLLLTGTSRAEDKNKASGDKLAGTWSVVSMVQDGKADDNAKDDQVTFASGEVTVKGKNGEHKATYKLDASQKPHTIDISPSAGPNKDKVLKGIYKVKGDELTICWTRNPGEERPKAFESKESSGLMLATLKREKP
jgi:uncharacterized protein (TIGR03067 family)